MSDRALDEYWKAFADDTRRMAHLELYRSGDFEKLAPYEGALARLGLGRGVHGIPSSASHIAAAGARRRHEAGDHRL